MAMKMAFPSLNCSVRGIPRNSDINDYFSHPCAGIETKRLIRGRILSSKAEEHSSEESDVSPSKKLAEPESLQVEIASHLEEAFAKDMLEKKSGSLIEKNLAKRRRKKEIEKDSEFSPQDSMLESKEVVSNNDSVIDLTYPLNAFLVNKFKDNFRPADEWFYGIEGESLRNSPSHVEQYLFDMMLGNEKPSRGYFSNDLTNVLKNNVFVPLVGISYTNGHIILCNKKEGDPAAAQKQIQENVDKFLPGLTCIIIKYIPTIYMGNLSTSGPILSTNAILLLRSDELLTFSLPQKYSRILSFGLLASTLFYAYGISLDISVPLQSSSWLNLVIPVSLLATMSGSFLGRFIASSFYKRSDVLSSPIPLVSPSFGCFGLLSLSKGFFPNRAAVMDVSFGSVVGSLAVSLILVAIGVLSNSDVPENLIVIPGDYFVIPSLSRWAAESAALTLVDVAGIDTLGINPFLFCGMLGIQFTLFNLLPLGITDGGRLLECMKFQLGFEYVPKFIDAAHLLVNLRRKWGPSYGLSAIAALALSYRLLEGHRLWDFGSLLLFLVPMFMRMDWFQIDEVSSPGDVRIVFGISLVVAAIVSLII